MGRKKKLTNMTRQEICKFCFPLTNMYLKKSKEERKRKMFVENRLSLGRPMHADKPARRNLNLKMPSREHFLSFRAYYHPSHATPLPILFRTIPKDLLHFDDLLTHLEIIRTCRLPRISFLHWNCFFVVPWKLWKGIVLQLGLWSIDSISYWNMIYTSLRWYLEENSSGTSF